MTSDRE